MARSSFQTKIKIFDKPPSEHLNMVIKIGTLKKVGRC